MTRAWWLGSKKKTSWLHHQDCFMHFTSVSLRYSAYRSDCIIIHCNIVYIHLEISAFSMSSCPMMSQSDRYLSSIYLQASNFQFLGCRMVTHEIDALCGYLLCSPITQNKRGRNNTDRLIIFGQKPQEAFRPRADPLAEPRQGGWCGGRVAIWTTTKLSQIPSECASRPKEQKRTRV